MLEGWVYHLVAGYLGNYIKDINREQFRIGLWSGEALLENVELRLEAFDYLQLPFAIKQGFVGKLRLQVPWTKLGWERIVIALEDVYICACPRDDSEWNADASEIRALAAKKAKLAAAEITKLSSRVPDEKVRQSFLSHLYAKIIDNIQVTIRNIHFRYANEDSHTPSFCFGAKLSGLTISTTDGRITSGASVGAKSRSSIVDKSVEVSQFSLYWNPASSSTKVSSPRTTIGQYISKWFAKKDEKLTYLLHPMDASLKLTINRAATVANPQYLLAAVVNNLSLNLEDHQLYEMCALWNSIQICQLREKYGRFRPNEGLSVAERRGANWQRLWWQYAINSVASDVQKKLRRNSWKYLDWRLDRRRRYTELYQKKLESFQKGELEDEIVKNLDELEKELDMDMILSYRSLAEKKLQLKDDSEDEYVDSLPKPKEDHVDGQQHQKGWLSRFSFGILGGTNSLDAAAESTGPLSSEIIKDLYRATNFHPALLLNGNEFSTGSDLVIKLQLNQAACKLENSFMNGSFLELHVQGVCVTSEQSRDLATVGITVKSFEIKDTCTVGSVFPHIAVPKGVRQSSKPRSYLEALNEGSGSNSQQLNEPVLGIRIEISEDPILKIEVLVRPMEFFHSESVTKALLQFFEFPDPYQTHQDGRFGAFHIEPVSQPRTRLMLQVDAKELVIVIPETNVSSHCSLLVLSMESAHLQLSKLETTSSAATNMHDASECYTLKMTNVLLKTGIGSPEFATLVDQFNLDMEILRYASFREFSPPQCKIDVRLSSMKVHLSLINCRAFRSVFNSVMRSAADESSGVSYEPKAAVAAMMSGSISIGTFDLELSLEGFPSVDAQFISLQAENTLLRFLKHGPQENFEITMGKLFVQKGNVVQSSLLRPCNHESSVSLALVRSSQDPLSMIVALHNIQGDIYPKVISAISLFMLSLSDPTSTKEEGMVLLPMTLQLENTILAFHDDMGVLGIVRLAAAEFSFVSSSEGWLLVGRGHNIQLEGPTFSTGKVTGAPLGSLSSGPSVVNVRVAKRPTDLELFFRLEEVQCILLSDYLALLIDYFKSPHWKLEQVTSEAVEETETVVHYTIEVSQSELVLPIGTGDYVKVAIPGFRFLFVPFSMRKSLKGSVDMNGIDDHSRSDAFYASGRQLSISTSSVGDAAGHCNTLTERLDGKVLIEVPDDDAEPARIQINFSVISFTLTGTSYLQQFQWVDITASELARVSKKISNAKMIRESYMEEMGSSVCWVEEKTSESLSFDLSCYIGKVDCCVQSSAQGRREAIIMGQANSVNALCSFKDGSLESLVVYVFKIEVSDGSFDSGQEHVDGNLLAVLKALDTDEMNFLNHAVARISAGVHPGEKKFELGLPIAEIWLYLTSWNRIISWIFLCFPMDLTSSSDGIAIENHSDELESNQKNSPSSSEIQSDDISGIIHSTVGISKLSFALPEYASKYGRKILFTSSLVVDELQVCNNGKCSFTAHVDQVAAETSDPSASYPCLAAVNADIKGDVDLYALILGLDINISSLDCCCSYPILQFLGDFNFEPFEDNDTLGIDLKSNISVNIGRSSLLLTDGRWNYNAPLMELVTEEMSAEIFWGLEHIKVMLSFSVEMSFHNIQKAVWEPLLEPWSASLTVVRGHAAKETVLTTKVEVTSSRNLNFNITEALSQAIARAMEMISWSNAGESANNEKRFSQYAPYWFQNDTGISVSYTLIWPTWVDENDSSYDHMHIDRGIILPGQSVPLYIPESDDMIGQRKSRWISTQVSERKKFGMTSHRRISLLLEGTSGGSLPMSIDLVGCRAFDVVFSKAVGASDNDKADGNRQSEITTEQGTTSSTFSTHVIFDVSVQHHSKLIRLRSPVAIANSTAVTLEVKLEIPFGIFSKVMDPVLPNEVVALPVHLAETGKIRWRPFGKDYLWSEAQSLSMLISASDRATSQRPVTCCSSRPSSGPFRCCIKVEDRAVPAVVEVIAKDSSVSGAVCNRKAWTIYLEAPLVLKNCLPSSLEVQIESSGGVNVHIFVPEGDTVFVYEVDIIHDLTLKVRIPNFLTTCVKFGRVTPTLAEEKAMKEEVIILSPETFSGCPLYAKVEKVTDLKSGARELCISVPYWLFNCSGLDLALVDGEDLSFGKENFLSGAVDEAGAQIRASVDPQGLQALQEITEAANFKKHPSKLVTHLPSQKLIAGDQQLHLCPRRSSENGMLVSNSSTEFRDRGNDLLQAYAYSPAKGVGLNENKMRVRLSKPGESNASAWSQPFLLDPPGGTTTIFIPQPDSREMYVLSVTSTPAMGTCSGKTKAVTFRPRFVLANSSRMDLCFKQQGTDSLQQLPVGQNIHLHWTDSSRNLLISVRYNEHGWEWSGGFAPDRLGDTQVKVYNHLTGMKEILRVEVSNVGKPGESSTERLGTFLILVTNDETGFMPYRVDNFSLERLRFYQKRCEKRESILQPYSCCDYAWDEPCLPPQLVVEIPGEGTLGAFELDEVKQYPVVAAQRNDRRFVVSVHAEGAKRVLSVVDINMHTPKVVSPQLSEQLSRSQRRESATLIFSLKLSGIGFSLVDSSPRELVYACAQGIFLEFVQVQRQQKLKLEIGAIQIDNQLSHATYPVLLCASKPKLLSSFESDGGVEAGENPAVSLTISKWMLRAGSVDCFECVHLSIAPLKLELEERNLTCLMSFTRRLTGFNMDDDKSFSFNLQPFVVPGSGSGSGSTDMFVRFIEMLESSERYKCWPAAGTVDPVKAPTKKAIMRARKVYIESFRIEPLELTVSFSSVPWLPKQDREVAAQSILWVTGSLLQRRLIALADVEGAPIRFRQLDLAHPMANWNSILGIIQRHYTRQLLHEIYKVLGSADVFGNPLSFMKSLGSGVWDFVSAPAKSKNPRQIVQGVSIGTRSLFRNTVFAFSNAATQMSKAAHKGVAILALDQDLDIHLHPHRDSSVVNEFLEGLTGLLQSSVRGAERHGIPGVFSGTAVGALRAVARPVASMLEVAGKTAQSIRNSSRPTSTQAKVMRVRLPRYLERGSPLLPYSWNEALGSVVLSEADSGRLKNEVYVTCERLAEKEMFVVLTERLLLQVKKGTSKGEEAREEWSIESEHAVEDILYVHRHDEENSLNILFCRPHVFLKRNRFLLAPFNNLTLVFNSAKCTDEFHSILLSSVNHKHSSRVSRL